MKNQEAIWDELYQSRLSWKKETIGLPNFLKGKSVLEIGVGNGKTLSSILRQNPKSVTAIDFSQEALNQASKIVKSENVKFVKANITDFQSDEQFDVIICYYVLNNILERDRKEAIAQMYKALKPGGTMVFEDFEVGDFREVVSGNIESHTIEREDGIICHFFGKKEVESLFKAFKIIKLSDKILHPIRTSPKLERKILSLIAKK